jgi:hypothetical protein
MHVHVPAAKASVFDRFKAAYYAFRMQTRPDVAAVEKAMEAYVQHQERLQKEDEVRQEKLRTAIDRLEGYDKALVTSVASGTANWRQLLGQVMPAIQQLDIEDQIGVMRHIVKNNPQAAGDLVVRNWVQSNTRAVFAQFPE